MTVAEIDQTVTRLYQLLDATGATRDGVFSHDDPQPPEPGSDVFFDVKKEAICIGQPGDYAEFSLAQVKEAEDYILTHYVDEEVIF